MNLLTNGDLNGNWWRKTFTGQEFGEIFVPEGWTAYWDESKGRPEMHVINAEEPYLNPPRVQEPPRAVKWFTFYRDHIAGIYQTVTGLKPGACYRFSAYVQAWYSQRDDPYKSEYQTDSGEWREIHNGDVGMSFALLVDMDGDADPWAAGESVTEAFIYNTYAQMTLEFVATGDTATVFIESGTLYPFKHCDAYVDNAVLELVEEPEPPQPGVDYVVVVELLPQDATKAEMAEVLERTYADRRTILQSADDAARLVAPGLPGSRVDAWGAERWPGDIVTWLHDHGVSEVIEREFWSEPEPPPDPDPDPTPIDKTPFVPNGIIVGWGTIGGNGQEPLFETLAALGCAPPTAKIVGGKTSQPTAAQVIKQFAPNTKIVGRMIDVMYNGQAYNVEGFGYTDDPVVQADVRMELLRYTMQNNPGVDFWEITNEQQPAYAQDIATIAEFYERAMVIAESWGKRLALFSFSTGNPQEDAWQYVPASVWQRAMDGGHAIALHEYGLWPREAGSQLLRFKRLYDEILIPGGYRIPLYITEYGVPREDWNTTDKPQQFIEYDNQLSKLWYVAGAHIFVNPWDPPYGDYTNYYPQYQQYAYSVKDRDNG